MVGDESQTGPARQRLPVGLRPNVTLTPKKAKSRDSEELRDLTRRLFQLADRLSSGISLSLR